MGFDRRGYYYRSVRDGDLVYIPRHAVHNIGNDGDETLEMLLIGVMLDP